MALGREGLELKDLAPVPTDGTYTVAVLCISFEAVEHDRVNHLSDTARLIGCGVSTMPTGAFTRGVLVLVTLSSGPTS